MKNYFLLLLTIISYSGVFSQKNSGQKTFNITGKVTDESGIPIKFVSINIRKKMIGTASSANGTYTLRNVTNGDSIIFTHIAYSPVMVGVKGNNLINVEMKQSVYRFGDFKITDSAHKTTISKRPEEKERYIFEKVEIMPYFKGGANALDKYFKNTIKYPEEAKNKNIEGEVIVGFIVGIKGEIRNIKIVKGISPDCDEVAFDAIKSMPAWIPGIQNGRETESYVELSILFSLITGN